MNKAIYGLISALLGAILGAGAVHFAGLFRPSAPAAPSAATPTGAASSKADGAGQPGASAQASNPAAGASGAGAAKGAGGAAPPAPVEIARPERVLWPRTVVAVGTLRSDESVSVRSEVSGRIVALNFQEGQPVKRGQVLVQLDDSVARAELEQAQANLRLAEAKFKRAVELRERNFISHQARDEAENALRVAEANVRLAEARLARYTIAAPFSGTVGLRSVGVGDYVKDGQDIVNLEKTEPIKVDFKVPELFQARLRPGQSLSVSFDALPGREVRGTVYAVNPQLDATGRAVVLRAQLPNRDGVLKPGMFARVRLSLGEAAETLAVPEQAVFMQGEDFVLYRVVDGRALRTKVEIGQRRQGKVELLSGVNAQDWIVVAGWQRLRDGAAVRVSPSAEGAETPSGAGAGGAGPRDAPREAVRLPAAGTSRGS
ncbi:MAG: efflux RND transporter periplasmic adaptor subunit [Casimicrobiaceae bacterium]|nr:efflux RND transporter periplasmic adaptor subunit [Casimicrobiaceae bacterium]MCX8098825.1 efflux RND transporter periplasmic adaptor subunit [Casimicrobiaceae bacterium]MDW8311522.1 efflux RND transporter periplasmic adaptor subunit [Burkholderiales bacterium]